MGVFGKHSFNDENIMHAKSLKLLYGLILAVKKISTLTIFLLMILTFPIIVPEIKAVSQRTIVFSGYEWIVKSSETAKAGPGPNYWLDENVWVDENGWLHLKITYKAGR